MAVHETDANRSRDRTRLTGRLRGHHHEAQRGCARSAVDACTVAEEYVQGRLAYRRHCWGCQRRSMGQPAINGSQSSSSRQTERAVQALQMGRASSMVPSGRGWSTPPSRQSTWIEGGLPGMMPTWRTEQRRIRPARGMRRRSSRPSIGLTAMGGSASVRARPCGLPASPRLAVAASWGQ